MIESTGKKVSMMTGEEFLPLPDDGRGQIFDRLERMVRGYTKNIDFVDLPYSSLRGPNETAAKFKRIAEADCFIFVNFGKFMSSRMLSHILLLLDLNQSQWLRTKKITLIDVPGFQRDLFYEHLNSYMIEQCFGYFSYPNVPNKRWFENSLPLQEAVKWLFEDKR